MKLKPSQEKPWFKYYPVDADQAENLVPRCKVYSYVKEIGEENPSPRSKRR